MTNKSLAEHFRAIMDQIDNIIEEDPTTVIETPDEKDVEDLLKTDRPTGIKKETIKDIPTLIEFLDQYSELDEWRNPDAAYNDAYYENIPLDVLLNVTSLAPSDIEKIASHTDPYKGDILIKHGQLTVFGSE